MQIALSKVNEEKKSTELSLVGLWNLHFFGSIFKSDELLQLLRGALWKQLGENFTVSYFETFQSTPSKGLEALFSGAFTSKPHKMGALT